MRLVYVLLSPTFGMHQYTADLANRMAAAGHEVHLVSTSRLPGDRYSPAVQIHTPLATRTTGFSREALSYPPISRLSELIYGLAPGVVHFTGPHLWNPLLVRRLLRGGLPVVHTIHDLDPHHGAGYGALLYAWNRLVSRSGVHILVHSAAYRERLLAAGLAPECVTATPLLHLFLAYGPDGVGERAPLDYGPWALFFGRLERYKGLTDLFSACALLEQSGAYSPAPSGPRVVVAGPGSLAGLWPGRLPAGLELRNRLIGDEEGIDLFRRCGLLVLPYVEASQSALIGAAYYYRKPVLVTRAGALPEYVEDGCTGYVVEPGQPEQLAACLQEMLADPARLAQMGAAGRAWYDWQRPVESQALCAMYEKVSGQP
jgi:glycosyltransferase involved in cell wall biosynthesis